MTTRTNKDGNYRTKINDWDIVTNWYSAPHVLLDRPTVAFFCGDVSITAKLSWIFGDSGVSCRDTTGIPIDVLLAFAKEVDSVNAKQDTIVKRGPLPPPIPDPTLEELVQRYKDGAFDPNKWNLCIDYNSVNRGEKTEDGGIKFTECIGFYVMGSGCGQCQHSFYWPRDKMTSERLEAWIKKTFNVDDVQYGVG